MSPNEDIHTVCPLIGCLKLEGPTAEVSIISRTSPFNGKAALTSIDFLANVT